MKANTARTYVGRPITVIAAELGISLTATSTRSKQSTSTRPPMGMSANDTVIPESGRNNALTSFAGGMRHKGASTEVIEAALQALNAERCVPPLDPAEVSAIAASVGKYEATMPNGVVHAPTDVGNAQRFADALQDAVRYVPQRGGWLVWTGTRWRRDDCNELTERAKEIAKNIYLEGAALSDQDAQFAIAKHCRNSQHGSRIKAMIEMAQSDPKLVVRANALDRDDYLLGVENGVVDLRTGKLLPAEQGRLMTRQAPVEFDKSAKCPRFEAFIACITKDDKKLIKFFRRMVGYILTGLTDEQCLFFFYGSGANGKSTFLNVLSRLLGTDYAAQTPSETLMVKRGGMSNDIARLDNLRLVTANEVEQGSLLSEGLVKTLTGGDTVTARFLHKEFFEFKPKLKLVIAGNSKPIIRGTDHGIWRRIRLIPFAVTIPKNDQDPKLEQKLRSELPGILNWAIAGCREYMRDGLNPPDVVTAAAAEYRDEMDVLKQWVDDCGVTDAQGTWQASYAYASYRNWSMNNGYMPMVSASFGREFGTRFNRVKKNSGNFYVGIREKGLADTMKERGLIA